jgi:opine dehydrogenase
MSAPAGGPQRPWHARTEPEKQVAGRNVVVTGADPETRLLAACLTLAGHEVVLLDTAPGESGPSAGAEAHPLHLITASGDHNVGLAVTRDPFEALGSCDVVLLAAPSQALAAVMALVLPLVEPRHSLVVLPGGLGTLACATWLRDRGRTDLPIIAGSDVSPFSGRLGADGRLELLASATMPGFGVFPARRADEAWALLAGLFPGAHLYPHALAAALASPLPWLRAAALLTGAAHGAAAGETCFTRGFTREVARVAEAVDAERQRLGAALGLELVPAPQMLHRWGLAPLGDLWASVHGSYVLTTAGTVQAESGGQLAEDVGFCLGPVAELADRVAVPMPLTRALITVAATMTGHGDAGWSPAELGLEGLDRDGLARYLELGATDA